MAPATAIPPPLPPSVEEAYRRKCIQLKQRTNEVEEANDAARLRLGRLKRQVEKMRLERAFLLEQLAKRTSTNVEDSDGSPSPPPTPKEKPLRIKRGHRKPSALTGLDASSSVPALPGFVAQTHSPSSDAFSAAQQPDAGKTNGVHNKAPKQPRSAFDLYCDDNRSSAKEKAKEGGDAADVDEELSRGWKELSDGRRDEYQARADQQSAEYEKEKAAFDAAKRNNGASAGNKADSNGNGSGEATESEPPRPGAGGEDQTPGQQDDVDMTNYDTDQETQGERLEE
ncbi:hypothetical protein N656DRAFT_750204 [Canariomyces notabilis]|uniref:HMG box domain-containing protein n=1 Tax=Canariomyces notabilis TaxID=2074819 RepID=A0AAN6TGW9_9PEZI|nr:hypothetical protein N656DRAFT_750204 [Canariomyces arenarius]